MGRFLFALLAACALCAAFAATPGVGGAPGVASAGTAEQNARAEQARRRCGRRLQIVFRRRGPDRFRCLRPARGLREARAEQRLVASSASTRLWRGRRTLARRLGRGRLRRVTGFEGSLVRSSQRVEGSLLPTGARPGARASRRLRPRAPRGFRLRSAAVTSRIRSARGGGEVQRTTTRARLAARRASKPRVSETGGSVVFEVAEEVGGDPCPTETGFVRGRGSVKVTRETSGSWGTSKEVAQVKFFMEARVGADGKLPPTYQVRYELTLSGTAGGSDGSGVATVPFDRPLNPSAVTAFFSDRVPRRAESAHARLIYDAFNRVKIASENHLRLAEDRFYRQAECNKVDQRPVEGVLLPDKSVLEASIKNRRRPGAEKKTDWNVKLTPKGNVRVTPTATKSVKGAPVRGKVSKGGARSNARAASPRTGAELRAGRRALGAVEIEGVSRLGRAVTSVPVAEVASTPPIPLFDIQVTYKETFHCGPVDIVTDQYTLHGSVNRRDPEDPTDAIGTGRVSGTYQQVNTNGCTPFDTTNVSDAEAPLRASYESSGPPLFGFGWVPPSVIRWAGFATRSGPGTKTETWTEPGGNASASYERTITISNLRQSTD